MSNTDRKKHWENIYQTKELKSVSWYQPIPETSLSFFEQFKAPQDAKIIDVGGGDSLLVDHLLNLGYSNVTVLDISEAAIERAKTRLGSKATLVKWIVADAADFSPTEQYDFWHDRAAFHFLTSDNEIRQYIETIGSHLTKDGILIIGTFSENGPEKCSGISIKRYSEKTMAETLRKYFEKIKCIVVDHMTPFNTIQNFVFCSFRRLASDTKDY
jgi:2-polyprenyl-3-methyl-5-hydroxy-6-metoxy-1,4-benzoquinol methylase